MLLQESLNISVERAPRAPTIKNKKAGVVQYGEEKTAALCVKTLKKHKSLLQQLRELSPTMCFKKTLLKNALRKAAEGNEFNLAQEHELKFVKQVCDRIMTMCQHVAVAQRRSKPPAWIAELFKDSPSLPDMLHAGAGLNTRQ